MKCDMQHHWVAPCTSVCNADFRRWYHWLCWHMFTMHLLATRSAVWSIWRWMSTGGRMTE